MADLVVFIVGPTGSGKSKLALMLAQKMRGEIISSDSMQVYKGMNIGTAKPSKSEQKKIPHHLIDLISPRAECSVFKFRTLAVGALKSIIKKKRLPIVAGGSGLYIKALIDGLSEYPGKHNKLRSQLEKQSASKLYQQLKRVDSARAGQLNPNDKKRIIRALEIYRQSKRPQSELRKETGGLASEHMMPLIFGVTRDRKELYERIEKRVDQMFREGWVNEVKKLQRKGFSKTAKFAIGYKEIPEYLSGKINEEIMNGEIKKRTRHLAKRQMTWFRRDLRIQWIPISKENYQPALKQMIRTIRKESHAS